MQARRTNMEDFVSHTHDFLRSGWTLLLVADGHGGSSTAETVATMLPKRLLEMLTTAEAKEPSPEEVKAAMERVFKDLDAEFRGTILYSGACVLCTLITPTHFITAFCGDCVSFVLRIHEDGTRVVVPLSWDHDPTSPKETARIEAAGLRVFEGRINGDLNISRSFGDFAFKNGKDEEYQSFAITVHPDVSIVERTPADVMLLLGSDGLVDFGFVSDKDRVPLFLLDALQREGHADPMHLAVLACDKAYKERSFDNLSALVWVSPEAAVRFGNYDRTASWPLYERKRRMQLLTGCTCATEKGCSCTPASLSGYDRCKCPADGSLCPICDPAEDPFQAAHEGV